MPTMEVAEAGTCTDAVVDWPYNEPSELKVSLAVIGPSLVR